MWRSFACALVSGLCLFVSCQRELISGEPCEFPFTFGGAEYSDCLRFGGREWCFTENGEFGVCASPVTLSLTPGAESSSRLLESEADEEMDCCALLSGIGFESNLPVVLIDTDGESIPDEPKIDGTICVYDFGRRKGALHLIGIEIRGSTSARDFAKKSYAVETRDAAGEDLDVSLLGFPNGSDWVLYGPELDPSMGMRNYLTMQLYQSTGAYASNTQYCEMFLLNDGRPHSLRHYNGIYILMEKIKRGDDRVAIEKLSLDEDISGGYIFKYDNNNFDPGDQIFNSTSSTLRFIVTYPAKDEVDPASLAYLGSYVGEVEAALATENRAAWERYIDEGSFVDMFLITELSKNPDGYRGSYYFHKNSGSVLFAGPPWDFNEAYGMCCGYPIEGYLNEGISTGMSGGSAISPNGWRFNICVQRRRCRVDPTDGVSSWFQILMEDAEFVSSVQSRWRALRSGAWSTENIRAYFTSIRREIEAPVERNLDRWDMELQEMDRFIDTDVWREEMESMESWTISRLEWMDTALDVSSSRPVAAPTAAPSLTAAG